MATTESRSGFRLPWSADRTASRDASEEHPEGDLQTDGAEPSASADETSTAVGPTSDSTADPATAVAAGIGEAVAPGPDNAPIAGPAPTRRPTKFIADLAHAMQAAAEQARAATLEQFRIEGSTYVEHIQARSVAHADSLRRRAEEDVASIKEWKKTEIARIREETEGRIAGRRGQLDGQLKRYAALGEQDVARIEGQIVAFEAEMASFFDELLAETDLTILAARAQQMPEAPAFDELDDSAFAALMVEPAVGIPVADSESSPQPGPTAVPAAESEPITGPAEAQTPSTTDLSFDRDAAMSAIKAAAQAAASVEVATAEAARAEAAADRAEFAAGHEADELDVAPPPGPDDDAPERDPRLAMLGLTPDFAAAEADAAEAAAAEISELDEGNLAARLADLVPSSTLGAPADGRPAAPLVSTQVVVTGLVSVASIASFKRHLGRQAGVRHVGVSSGPEGEFLFTVQHEAEVALRDLIPTLPGFQARVTGGGDGIVTASARDPED